MDEIDKEAIKRLCEYEIASSWWSGYMCFDWMRNLASRYFLWKTKRKYKRYINYLTIKKALNEKK